jgi:hypothetical protein
MSGIAAEKCECGCSVVLNLGGEHDDEPTSWRVLDPDYPLEEPVVGLLDDDALRDAVYRTLVAQAGFEETITCVCGRRYRALNHNPWIERDEENER